MKTVKISIFAVVITSMVLLAGCDKSIKLLPKEELFKKIEAVHETNLSYYNVNCQPNSSNNKAGKPDPNCAVARDVRYVTKEGLRKRFESAYAAEEQGIANGAYN